MGQPPGELAQLERAYANFLDEIIQVLNLRFCSLAL